MPNPQAALSDRVAEIEVASPQSIQIERHKCDGGCGKCALQQSQCCYAVEILRGVTIQGLNATVLRAASRRFGSALDLRSAAREDRRKGVDDD
jgi:hypothetical protein